MPSHQGPLGVDDLRRVVAIMAIGIPLTVRVFFGYEPTYRHHPTRETGWFLLRQQHS